MKMQLHAFRRRDWLQQYANPKSLQKFLQTFGAFILFYFTCEREDIRHVCTRVLQAYIAALSLPALSLCSEN